jgi:beta-glucosidase
MARKIVQVLVPGFLATLALTLTGQPADTPAYRNPDLSPEKRAADLVGRMTLEEKILQMQNNAPAIERLGVPAYGWWNEALHGVARAGQATVFPQAIGLAATWNSASATSSPPKPAPNITTPSAATSAGSIRD